MRIYIATYWATCRGAKEKKAGVDSSAHVKVVSKLKYPYILESYHYLTANIVEAIRKDKATIFLDSGAFTMFTQGVTVDLEAFATFIKKQADIIHVASNLDVIGAGGEALTYERQKTLEKSGVKIQPVFHARDKDEWLVRYLEEGYDYIFLGGMVPESTDYLQEWLDRIWDKYLTNADGTPKVKVHGFGLTSSQLMFRYPWYSVDSLTWRLCAGYGGIFVPTWTPQGEFRYDKTPIATKITVRGSTREIIMRRYDFLSTEEKEQVQRYVTMHGFKFGKSVMGADGKEIIVEPGLVNSHRQRELNNIMFFEEFLSHLEPFPNRPYKGKALMAQDFNFV